MLQLVKFILLQDALDASIIETSIVASVKCNRGPADALSDRATVSASNPMISLPYRTRFIDGTAADAAADNDAPIANSRFDFKQRPRYTVVLVLLL